MTPEGIRIIQKISASDGAFPTMPAEVVRALEQMLQHMQEALAAANDGLEAEAKRAFDSAGAVFVEDILPTTLLMFAMLQARKGASA